MTAVYYRLHTIRYTAHYNKYIIYINMYVRTRFVDIFHRVCIHPEEEEVEKNMRANDTQYKTCHGKKRAGRRSGKL